MIACSSLHQVSKVSQTQINQVLLSVGLKVRNPTQDFSCGSYSALYADSFAEPKLTETLKCLNSIKDGSVVYSYQMEPAPRLVFKEASKNAQCMKDVFPEMKIPKELYFVAKSEVRSEWECYAVNLNVMSGEFADIKIPWDRYKLEIKFPLSRELKKPVDLQIWLMVNLLESMKAEMGGTLKGSMVPERVCQQCYRNTPWWQDQVKDKLPPIYWP